MILSLERWLTLTPSVASLQALTSRSSVFAASRRTTEAPPRRCSRRGRISGRPWRPKLTDSAAPMAPECQSFLDNVVAQRHLIAELPRGNHSRETGSIATACLARSSSPLSPTTHSRSNGDFPVLAEYPPNGRGCLARFCLCNGVFESSQPFRPLCLCPQNSVSCQRRLRFEETRFECRIKPSRRRR